ncbi:unnamed protein product [Prunus brigantina]
MMASRAPRRAVGINAKSSATHATTIGGCETSVARRVRSSRIEGSKKLLGSGSAFNATPASSAADRAQVHWKVAPERVRAPHFEKVRLLEAWHGVACLALACRGLGLGMP